MSYHRCSYFPRILGKRTTWVMAPYQILPLFVKGWRLQSIKIMHREWRYCCDHHSSLTCQEASLVHGPIPAFQCCMLKNTSRSTWYVKSCASYDKPFKLVAQNVQIHKAIIGSCHVICDTLTLCTRPFRLLCAALEKLETEIIMEQGRQWYTITFNFYTTKTLQMLLVIIQTMLQLAVKWHKRSWPQIFAYYPGFWFFVVLFCHLISS